MTVALKSLYALLIVLTFAFTGLEIGVPVRSIVLIALFAALAAFFPTQFSVYFERHIQFFLFCAALSAVGFALTIAQGREALDAFQAMSEIIVQLYLTTSCVYILCMLLGPRYVSGVFLAAALVTGAVAIFQYFGVDFFWQIRYNLSKFQPEDPFIQEFHTYKARAVGLSYSIINLSYQIISGLLVALMLNRARLVPPILFNGLVIFAVLVGLASGVRSLILAIILVALIYYFWGESDSDWKRRISVYVSALIVIATMSILLVSNPESRVFSVSDSSAVGRIALAKLGINLFLDHPFGFGWGFDSKEFFWIYWEELRDHAVYEVGLHNFFLNFALTYGVLGGILILVAFISEIRQFLLALLIFAPYYVNAFFHNGGPLYGELYFWFAYGVFLYLHDQRLLWKRRADTKSEPAWAG